MSYDASQLSSSALYRVRFNIADNDLYNEFLSDDEINYLLSTSSTEVSATISSAKRVVGILTGSVRSREGNIESYGSDHWKQYRVYLDDLIQELTATSNTSYMILGGTVASEVDRVKSDNQSVGNGYELDYIDNQRTWLSSGAIGNVTENPFRLK